MLMSSFGGDSTHKCLLAMSKVDCLHANWPSNMGPLNTEGLFEGPSGNEFHMFVTCYLCLLCFKFDLKSVLCTANTLVVFRNKVNPRPTVSQLLCRSAGGCWPFASESERHKTCVAESEKWCTPKHTPRTRKKDDPKRCHTGAKNPNKHVNQRMIDIVVCEFVCPPW